MRLLAVLLFLGSLVLNALANRLPLNGKTTGELSAQYPNLFVPAGVTFSIWGVIYLLLLAWAIVQFLSGGSATGRRIAPWFALASVLNGSWILAWHYEFVALSVVIMSGLLITLLVLNTKLLPGKTTPDGTPPHLLARMAFGVYLGWISVATIANVTALLVASGWEGEPLSQAAWAMIMVVVGGGAGVVAVWRLRSPWVGLAVTWALVGIVLNRSGDVAAVAWTAAVCAAIVAVSTLTGFLPRGAS
jgi:translocator protein